MKNRVVWPGPNRIRQLNFPDLTNKTVIEPHFIPCIPITTITIAHINISFINNITLLYVSVPIVADMLFFLPFTVTVLLSLNVVNTSYNQLASCTFNCYIEGTFDTMKRMHHLFL